MVFEYKIETIFGKDSLQEKELNRLGEKGWELVSVQTKSDRYRIYFLKRLKS